MNYNKKISGAIIILAISLLVIIANTYAITRFIPTLVSILFIVIFPLLGYALTYKGTKNGNRLPIIGSILFYSLFISSVIGTLYSVKKIPLDLIEICYLSFASFILISIIYCLIVKCKNVTFPAFISIILILAAAVIVWKAIELDFISEHSLWYGIAMLILLIFHYIVVLVARRKDINIIKATSIGYGAIFWLISIFLTEGVANFPEIKEDKNNKD